MVSAAKRHVQTSEQLPDSVSALSTEHKQQGRRTEVLRHATNCGGFQLCVKKLQVTMTRVDVGNDRRLDGVFMLVLNKLYPTKHLELKLATILASRNMTRLSSFKALSSTTSRQGISTRRSRTSPQTHRDWARAARPPTHVRPYPYFFVFCGWQTVLHGKTTTTRHDHVYNNTSTLTHVRAGALVPPPPCLGGGATRVDPGQ